MARHISLSILIVTSNLILLVRLACVSVILILVSKLALRPGYVRKTRLTMQEILLKMNSATGMARKTRLPRTVSLARLRRPIRGYG